MTLTDDSIMPFGKYKKTQTKMANVPASYLLWLYDQNKGAKPFGVPAQAVKTYTLDNMDVLRKEVKCNE